MKTTSLILTSLCLLGGSLFAAETRTAPRPNIVFILCDDLGYGDVGVFYQNQRAALKDRSLPSFSTPHIDTLARDGVKLMQHYSGAPVCAPSRASLLSGLTQGNASVRDNQFDKALADTHTLGTVLRQAGYATAAFGKWGLQGSEKRDNKGKKGKNTEAPESEGAEKSGGVMPEAWRAYPTKRGFDYYFGYVRHVDGHFHYPKEDKREVWENDREVSAALDLCYTTDLFTAMAKKWITEQTAAYPQQPFFIYLAYDTPHAKLQNPPCAYPVGGGLAGGVQWTGEPHAMLNTATGTVDGYMFPDYAQATWDDDHNPATPEVPWPDVQKRYANDVCRIDCCVGDLLQLLKDVKIDDNTLVVFTSDNGPSQESYLPEKYVPTFFRGFGPFDGIKRDTWEGGMREPTLARWPRGIPAGRVDFPLAHAYSNTQNEKGQPMRTPLLPLLALTGTLWMHSSAADAAKPNIVLIVADDLGYADVLFNPRHAKEVTTPHLDALAQAGIVCRQGYVTGNVCSPTRAALMTGRYQQRLGLYTAGEAGSGVPMSEKIFPQYLTPAGYVSMQIGKWHLGPTPEWSPARRGFDEVFGFLGRGAHDYFKLDDPNDPIYRGTQPVKEHGYLTDRWGEEAVAFIERNKSRPFFLYLAFNAVHAPLQAPADEIAKFNTGNQDRDTLLAMGKRMDDAVGKVVATLKREGVWENTLLFFISDNGGPLKQTADNSPLRGGKHQDYEGGIRVPFLVCWPGQLRPGQSQAVVNALDILPTSLAAAGLPMPAEKPLDGINLLPVLRGESPAAPRNLFWSSGGEEGWWAVRSGDWKLVGDRGQVGLFDLGKDVSETHDLAKQRPEKVAELTKLHDAWLAEMADPIRGEAKRFGMTPAEGNKPKKPRRERKPVPDSAPANPAASVAPGNKARFDLVSSK